MKSIEVKPRKQKLNGQLRLYISQAVAEIINDPDYGLELSEKTKARLQRARKQDNKTVSLEEIKKKYL